MLQNTALHFSNNVSFINVAFFMKMKTFLLSRDGGGGRINIKPKQVIHASIMVMAQTSLGHHCNFLCH